MSYQEDFNKHTTDAKEKFKNHKASLVVDTDRFTVIDWRNENGSSVYYINFIVDKARGVFTISGDLGECIAWWGNKLSVSDLKKYICDDVGYFISKFQCSTDKYVYDEEDAVNDIIRRLEDYFQTSFAEIVWNCAATTKNEDDYRQDILYEISDCIRTGDCQEELFVPTSYLCDLIANLGLDSYETHEIIYECGKKISPRIFYWVEGFVEACNQLGF